MDKGIQEILGDLEAFEKTHESIAVELRMSLISIVLHHMRAKQWNQRTLARATNKAESFISRVLSGSRNSTIDTFAELLHAVGARGRIVERVEDQVDTTLLESVNYSEESRTDARQNYIEEESWQETTKDVWELSSEAQVCNAFRLAG